MILPSTEVQPIEAESVGAAAANVRAVIEESNFTVAEVRNLAKNSLDFLAGIAMPADYMFEFPPVYLAVWSFILQHVSVERIFPQLALGLPRGFAKTTLMKLAILYCILFTRKRFILIVSDTATKAEAILSDVMDMLEESNIKKVFGDWKLGVEKDTQAAKKFGYCGRNIIIKAIGTGTSVRGINEKNARPDVILMDDIQSSECAESEHLSRQLETWMLGPLMKAKSPFGCLFLFVGNMYATKWSTLKKLKKNPNWIKFIAGGLLADGTSLWEDLQPREQLLREFQNDLAAGRPEIFYAEVLNDDEAALNTIIDLSKLPEVPYKEGDIPLGSFIIIDPSGEKETSDAVSIGYFEVHGNTPILMEIKEGRMSADRNMREALELALRRGCPLIVIEATAYQATLCSRFNELTSELGIIGLEAVEIYPGRASKPHRIVPMFRTYADGDLFIHDQCAYTAIDGTRPTVPEHISTHGKAAVHQQISMYNPLVNKNTDGLLDLMTYAPKVMDDYGVMIVNMNIISLQDSDALKVQDNNHCF